MADYEKRPWGEFYVLRANGKYKVKRLIVYPGQRTSLQYHNHREEHWIFTEGIGSTTLIKDAITSMYEAYPSKYMFIPKGAAHRITNTGKELLYFIEVQIGDYLEEDDIVRLEDDYNRETL